MKNIILNIATKQIHKHIKHHTNIPNYFFWRWMISKVGDKDLEQDIIFRLDSAVAVCGSTNLINFINDVFVFDGKLYIVTHRPGIWIGKRGHQIDEIQKAVGCEIVLVENRKDGLMKFLNSHYASINNW